MKSIEQLASIKPKENAGPRASNRFSYQINWGLKKLLELEANDEDYIMVLDYHDDIVVCNSEKQEDYIDFFQVKTKTTGYWRMADLKASSAKHEGDDVVTNAQSDQNKSDENLSILSKLIRHVQVFDASRYLYFVTNQRLSPNFCKSGEEFIAFSSLDDKTKKSIKEAVCSELGDLDESVFDKLVFIQNQMNVNDYQNTMLGMLASFLKEKFDTATDVPVIYENIISLLRGKNDYEVETSEKSELLRYKSISHSDFRRYLIGITKLKSYDDIVNTINSELKDAIGYTCRLDVKNCLKQLKTDLLDYESEEVVTLIPLIKTALDVVSTEGVNSLWEHACRIYDSIKDKYVNYKGHSDVYIKSVIMYVAEC